MHDRDHLGLELSDGLSNFGKIGKCLVIRQAHGAHLGAHSRRHLSDSVAVNPGADRQNPIAGDQAALEAAPQRHHALAQEDDHRIPGLEDGLEVCLGLGVKLDVLFFEVGGAVVDAVGL